MPHLKALCNLVHLRRTASSQSSVPGRRRVKPPFFSKWRRVWILFTIDRTPLRVLLDNAHGGPTKTGPIWARYDGPLNATAVTG
jgi:hypothetical protein